MIGRRLNLECRQILNFLEYWMEIAPEYLQVSQILKQYIFDRIDDEGFIMAGLQDLFIALDILEENLNIKQTELNANRSILNALRNYLKDQVE